MNLRLAAARALRKLHQEGVVATVRTAVWYLVWYLTPRTSSLDPFDVAHGTDTGGSVPALQLGGDYQSLLLAHPYAASDPRALIEAVEFTKIMPSQFSFIDLGCGKGRALIVAAELGFKRIIGIDLSAPLVEIAKSNINKLSINNSSLINADATQYSFPDDDFVLFLANPFPAEVMQRVIENLRAARARSIFVIYDVPVCAELFDRCDFLVRLGSPPGHDSKKEPSGKSAPRGKRALSHGLNKTWDDLSNDVIVWTTAGKDARS